MSYVARGTRLRRRSVRGQALVEFAIVSTVLLLLLGGVVDFGFLLANKIEVNGAARAAARWAALNSTAWSAAPAPSSNTIQGQARAAAGGTASIPNDDSHILIRYYAVSGATTTWCGSYSTSGGGGFVPQSGYTQGTCVTPGSIVRVQLTSSYPVFTPIVRQLFGAGIQVSGAAAMVIQQ